MSKADKSKTEKIRMGEDIKLHQMVCFALYGASHAFSRAYKPLLDPLGLTYPQYLVMISFGKRMVSRSGTGGGAGARFPARCRPS